VLSRPRTLSAFLGQKCLLRMPLSAHRRIKRSWGYAPSFSAQGPDFLHGAPPRAACAAFIKESRMKYANARKLDRKSGGALWRTWGTRPSPWTLVR
jgi:hypothetical protein